VPGKFSFVEVNGEKAEIDIEDGGLIFSFCQTPVVYRTANGPAEIVIEYQDGKRVSRPGNQLSAEESQALFDRTGSIRRIDVSVPNFS
jgi:hypothetical protein